jgi:hypothetical protein
MSRELSAWSTRPLSGRGEIVELVDHTGRRIMLASRTEGRLLADLHNRVVDDAHQAIAAAKEGERVTVGDIEALVVRVLIAAAKELARGVLPRRLRRGSTLVRKPVDGPAGTAAGDGVRR